MKEQLLRKALIKSLMSKVRQVKSNYQKAMELPETKKLCC